MGAIFDLLISESFRKHPVMYAGRDRSDYLQAWLVGLQFGHRLATGEDDSELDGFREWLHMRLDGPGNMDWVGILEWKFGTDEAWLTKSLDLLDEFVREVSSVGREGILEEHADYERQRYGFLSSSRLRLAKGQKQARSDPIGRVVDDPEQPN